MTVLTVSPVTDDFSNIQSFLEYDHDESPLNDIDFISVDEDEGTISIANDDFKKELLRLDPKIIPSMHTLYNKHDPDEVKVRKDGMKFSLESMANRHSVLVEKLKTDQKLPEEIKDQMQTLTVFLADKFMSLKKNIESEINNPEGVTFAYLPKILTRGKEVLVRNPKGNLVGTIRETSLRSNPFSGPYIFILFDFYRFDGSRFIISQHTSYIDFYPGREKFENLPVDINVSEEAIKELSARGKKYITLNSKPGYVNYSGHMSRQGWFSTFKFESTGRIMVDIKSMSKMDPNYDYYFGGSISDGSHGNSRGGLNVEKLSDKDLAKFAPVVYGFSFKTKMWGEFSIDSISDIVFDKDVFDKVIIDENRKALIKAIVETNVEESADLISGKGSGIIALLHGNPGIGKTLTAEAVSEALEKPLYMVGVAELGTEPSELEDNLRNVLETAKIWDAVLLLDEADIFLEERKSNDIVRNAMVGIFLRLLEYYDGIMFLTTNRASNIDRAFYSRISLALHYCDLGVDARKSVWKNCLKHVEGFNYDSLAVHELNGRQIKNCVNLGNILAKSKNKSLSQEDLDYVVNLSSEFEKVLKAH